MTGDGFDRVLAAARDGDDRAWGQLYRHVAPVVRGYLGGRRCPNVDDVASETLLQVVRDLDRFAGGEAAFRSWALTIAHHRLIDARRRSGVRPAEPCEPVALEAALPAESFEDRTVTRLSDDVVEPLLAATSVEQRDVLRLRYVGDLSLHEVAVVLGKRYDAVKALHRRGLHTLRARADAPPRASGHPGPARRRR
jgi:RNA polymerase sigma factor (sigma-70 family)